MLAPSLLLVSQVTPKAVAIVITYRSCLTKLKTFSFFGQLLLSLVQLSPTNQPTAPTNNNFQLSTFCSRSSRCAARKRKKSHGGGISNQRWFNIYCCLSFVFFCCFAVGGASFELCVASVRKRPPFVFDSLWELSQRAKHGVCATRRPVCGMRYGRRCCRHRSWSWHRGHHGTSCWRANDGSSIVGLGLAAVVSP